MELEKEQNEIKTTMKELAPMISSLQEENLKLARSNEEIRIMFDAVNEFAKKKTEEKKMLTDAQQKLIKIYTGATALTVAPHLKQIYRGCIYKCAQGVLASASYDHALYEDITDSIRAIELELGCEPLSFDHPQADHFTSQSQDSYIFCGSIEFEEDDAIFDSDDEDNTQIDVAEFTEEVEKQSAALGNLSNVVDADQLSTLYENKDMLLAIFKFMDTDGNGTIDIEEFQVGIDLLNKRLPAGSYFKDHEDLFRALDVDGNGEIDIDEFDLVFSQNANTSEYSWD